MVYRIVVWNSWTLFYETEQKPAGIIFLDWFTDTERIILQNRKPTTNDTNMQKYPVSTFKGKIYVSTFRYFIPNWGLNINTRQIKIQLPLYLNPRYSPMETSGKENLKLISIYKTFLVPHISSIEYAIKCIF